MWEVLRARPNQRTRMLGLYHQILAVSLGLDLPEPQSAHHICLSVYLVVAVCFITYIMLTFFQNGQMDLIQVLTVTLC